MNNLPHELSNHPSLVGIIRMPKTKFVTLKPLEIPYLIQSNNTFTSGTITAQVASEIFSDILQSNDFTIEKSKVTDFFPYTYYLLSDGECEPLVMHPQYMKDKTHFISLAALSHQPVERYYPSVYRGDTTGRVFNITNVNQMMLPTATSEGLSYLNANANTINQGRRNMMQEVTLSGTGQVAGALASAATGIATGGLLGGLISGVTSAFNASRSINSGINAIKLSDARQKDHLLQPSTISSFGTPSTRNMFGTDSVNLYKMTVLPSVKQKIESYNRRYANKFNNYAKIDIKNYKGYIKYVQPDVDGTIDMSFMNKIIEILERGVYIE